MGNFRGVLGFYGDYYLRGFSIGVAVGKPVS
jgi:hypothetical protein